jgi:carbonic anhydrase/acetyltransferase-like protein (isoleucine patch superfamily)
VINGNVFITGSVNANKLAANDIYTLKLQSTNATFGSPTGFGFWFDAASGNAYMANTVTIGNQLRVGNTANIGNNLTVGTNLTVGANANIGGNLIIGANTTIGGNLTIGNNANIGANAVIGGNLTIGGLATNGTLNANTVSNNNIVAGNIAGSKLIPGTITAAQIAAGTITATQISASYVYAGNIISTNAANSFPNINSPGYWLRFDTGDARFGGNVSIGNNLTVGNLITTSQLNANTVTYNNIVAGTIPPPQGQGFFNPTNITLNSSAAYDGVYTSGSVFGYYKTLQYVTIPVTSSMAALPNSSALNFLGNFSAQVTATGILAGSNGPLFYMFTNIQQSNNTWGGSGQLQAIPFNAIPIPAGGDNNPGSLLGPQFGRTLAQGVATSYTGPLSFSASVLTPQAGGTLTLGSTMVIGIAMFNAVNPAQLGQITLNNMAFNVILQT